MQERPWLQWNIQRPHCPNILGANKQFIKVICGREPTTFDPLVNSCLTQNNFLDFPEKIKGDRVKINYFFLNHIFDISHPAEMWEWKSQWTAAPPRMTKSLQIIRGKWNWLSDNHILQTKNGLPFPKTLKEMLKFTDFTVGC